MPKEYTFPFSIKGLKYINKNVLKIICIFKNIIIYIYTYTYLLI